MANNSAPNGEQTELDLIRGLYDAFARGDVPTVLGMLDPEVRWYESESNPYMPSGEPFVGPDAVLQNLFMRLADDWDGFSLNPWAFHDAGDVVVVEARYGGTHKASGKALDAQVCHLWTVKGGKVAKFQQYVDTAKFVEAMEGTVAA